MAILSPNSIHIDLSALVHNLNQAKMLLSSATKIMGIVKSDAYGHGLIPVSKTLEEHGVSSLGVAFVHEALELRRGGAKLPIFILCGLRSREEMVAAVDHKLIPVLSDMISLRTINRLALEKKADFVKIHLKVDTGMGRLGLPHEDLEEILQEVSRHPYIKVEGFMSHLACADSVSETFTSEQIARFKRAIEMGRAMGLKLPLNHIANSAGLIAHNASHFDMVRPGVMLYGGLPCPEFQSEVSLRPVMTLKGKVIQVRDMPNQTPVSYGRRFFTKGNARIAILSGGYADGVMRGLSNKGTVLISGRKWPIVGTVCMNMTMVDVTGMDNIKPGDEVVFLGAQGDEVITADAIARWNETISYEVFCAMGRANRKGYRP
jgi:alanine racemase